MASNSITRTLIAVSFFISAVISSRANDNADLVKMLQSNADGHFCNNLNNMINQSFTLDRRSLVDLPLWYQADCIFDTVKKKVDKYPDASQALAGFWDFLGRERNAHYPPGIKDNGPYGRWESTLENAIKAGLVSKKNKKIIPDITTVLGYVTLNCGHVATRVEDGITYLIENYGAKPDQHVVLYGATSTGQPTPQGTPRQFVQKNCPDLLNALSGG